MPLAILFDLDDTLISTNMTAFQPAYFHALGAALADLAPAKDIANQILKAVAVMQENQNPCRMLEKIFAENFYPQLGGTEEAFRQVLEDFYRNEFPKLRKVTQPRPEARELIDWCKSEDITMAIATNPLFPRIATRQRIEWAGLDPSDFVFFSSFNDFHFTKPTLTYYAECLGRLGWPDGNIVMVGDNLKYDLLPMQAMGFSTYWVTSHPADDPQPHGTLGEVQFWLQEQQSHQTSGLLDTTEVNLAIMRATPAVFDSLIKSLPSDSFKKKPARDEWNFTEVLWHLAEMEQNVYLPQWRLLLEDEDASDFLARHQPVG